jgi:hypothetical protein
LNCAGNVSPSKGKRQDICLVQEYSYLNFVLSTDIQYWHDYHAFRLHIPTAQYELIHMSHYHESCIKCKFLLQCGLVGCKGSLSSGVYRVRGSLKSQARAWDSIRSQVYTEDKNLAENSLLVSLLITAMIPAPFKCESHVEVSDPRTPALCSRSNKMAHLEVLEDLDQVWSRLPDRKVVALCRPDKLGSCPKRSVPPSQCCVDDVLPIPAHDHKSAVAVVLEVCWEDF